MKKPISPRNQGPAPRTKRSTGRPKSASGRSGLASGRPKSASDRTEFKPARPKSASGRSGLASGRPKSASDRTEFKPGRPKSASGRSGFASGRSESADFKKSDRNKSFRPGFGKDPDFQAKGAGRLVVKKKPMGPGQNKKHYGDTVRLNRYIANAGVCSRREADMLIENGAITVNGQIVTQMGYQVKPGDSVMYGSQKLTNEKKVYILLNKPKDYITTSDDPQERKTVMDLIQNACRERVYPVGRLDRNTTGLLLLTNDGDLARNLTHPKYGVKKLYHVQLDKPLTRADLAEIANGVKIEGEVVVPDAIAYAGTGEDKKELGIELHSGQNRVVRRIFEHFGYKVAKLDRVIFAGLTKKDLPRGKWRFLTPKEVGFLKMKG